MTRVTTTRLLDRTFEEFALCLGGLAASGEIPDSLIPKLIAALAGIRRIALRRAAHAAELPKKSPIRPHPAITAFLSGMRARGTARGTP
ncbi:MAG: hypothetical protein H0X38_08305 [Planctomycetes bacterium]|nr:hypothetical protein [Planctomycetota bacterium]